MQCFIVLSSEVGNKRVDPSAYQPAIMREIKRLQRAPHKLFPLKDVVDFGRDIIISNELNLPYVGLENIESQTGIFVKSAEEKSEFGSAARFKKGDVLFPKLRPYLNKVFLADFDGCCSTEFYVLRGKKLLSAYLSSFLSSQIVVNQTSCLMTGNTLPRLQTEDVEGLLIPVPSDDIQRRVIALMDKAHQLKKEKESEAEKLLSSIDNYVLSELGINFTKVEKKKCFVVMSDKIKGGRIDPNLYLLETNYDGTQLFASCSLDELCNMYQPKTITQQEMVNDGQYKVYGANGHIGFYDKFNHEEPEVLITCRGATCGTINMSEPWSWITGNAMVTRPITDKITKEYLFVVLQSLDLSEIITGSAQPQITRENLKKFRIPVPPLEIQNKISSEVKARMAKADQLKEEAKSLLQKAKDKVEKIILGGE